VVPDLARRPLGDRPAEIQRVNPVRNVHDQVHVVLDQQNGDPEFVADVEDETGDVLRLFLVHPGDDLVEQNDLRIGGERAGEFDPLLLAVGQRPDDLVADVLDLQELDDFLRALAGEHLLAARAAEVKHRFQDTGLQTPVLAHQNVVHDRSVLEQCEVLEGASDAEAHIIVRGDARHVAPVDEYPSGTGRQHPRDQVEERRLAGAVRADDRNDLAVVHRERDIVDRLDAAKGL